MASLMEELEGILTERKKKRKDRSLKAHVQRSRKAIGGVPYDKDPRTGKPIRYGGLRGAMEDQAKAARAMVYEKGRSPSAETAMQARHVERTGVKPLAPPESEYRHARRAIRVHRNVIKAGEKGVRVTPEEMGKRMRAGEEGRKAAAAQRRAARVEHIGQQSRETLKRIRKNIEVTQDAAKDLRRKRSPTMQQIEAGMHPAPTQRYFEPPEIPESEMKHTRRAQQVHRTVAKAAERGVLVTPRQIARRLAKRAARRLPVVGAALTGYSAARGILENPSDAGRVVAREVFGINLPERKKRKR